MKRPSTPLPLLAAAALASLPATGQAAVETFAQAVSSLGPGYLYAPWSSNPIDLRNDGCGAGVCITTIAQASALGLHGVYYQASGGLYWGGGGFTVVQSQAWLTIVADTPGGPGFVDGSLNLQLTGATWLAAAGGGRAGGSFKVSIDALDNHAWLLESAAIGQDPATPGASQMTRVDADEVRGTLTHLPVGQPFQLTLGLHLNGSADATGSSSANVNYGLNFLEGAPVFALPPGYSVWSSDWAIADNQFCPNGCAAVPEPSGGWMMLAGLALLPWLARRVSGHREGDLA